MARAYVNQNSLLPYHITARCSNRVRFGQNLDTVWSIMEDYLFYSHIKHGFKIHSFLLMPNHFHLIASLSDYTIGEVMREFLTNTSKEMNRLSGKINQNWGSKYFKCELTSTNYFLNTYKYVYQNPLRSSLVERCEDWRYSTLNGLVGNSKLIIPVEKDLILFNPDFDEKQLAWLNAHITPSDYFEMKSALSKRVFKLPKNSNKNLSKLESAKI